MPAVYISIGSNIEPEKNIPAALRLLAKDVSITAISKFYRTQPVGADGSPEFYNGAVRVETGIGPRDLKFRVLRRIEKTLSRTRGPDRNAPRTIDLDIILYGDLVMRGPALEIPNPDILTRPFVAIPIYELAPDLALPDTELPLAHIVKRMTCIDMVPLDEFTERLRKEILREQAKS